MTIEENVSLAPLTTLKVGGPARYYADIDTLKDLESAVKFARGKGIPVFALGGGSNVLISDRGFLGLVLYIKLKGVDIKQLGGEKVRVTACGGEDWDALVEKSVEKGLYGIENLSYVPGSVGASPIQNIGCYGAELSDVVDWVEVFDTVSLKLIKMNREECEFGYRTSIFKKDTSERRIVTRISLILSQTGTPNIEYHDFTRYKEEGKEEIKNPKNVRKALFDIRNRKGMTIVAIDSYMSAGSFFKASKPVTRPTIEKIRSMVLRENQKKAESLEPWNWELADGRYKIAPAFLLEFTPYNKTDYKGKAYNKTVGISPKHSLSLINLGGACAQDFYDFVKEIQSAVYDKFGIKLENEVRFIGDF